MEVPIDLFIFSKIQDRDSSSFIATAVYVKENGTFRQLKELAKNALINHTAKALNFVNEVTTMLYEGDTRADENEYMLLQLTMFF